MLVEDIENMFWHELTVPILEGGSLTEGNLFWDLLEAELPDLAARAIALLVEQKEEKRNGDLARLKYRDACIAVFKLLLEDAIIQPIVTAFDIADFQY